MKLYIVRHGQSVANVLGEFSNTGRKHPLTERGVEQAQALAWELAGLRAEQVYASPLLRAQQTAEILTNITPAFAVRQGFPTTSYAVAETRSDGLYCLSWGGVSPVGG